MNRGGAFFMMLAVILITFFVVALTFFSDVANRESTQKRVETLNNFVISTEEDIERSLYIAEFRTIFLFEQRIIESGIYIDDVESRFEEAFYSGTLYGEEEPLLTGVTYEDIEDIMKEKANKLGADISFSNSSLEVNQVDPWNVNARFTLTFVAEDLSGLVKWNRTYTSEVLVPLNNFADPIYLVNTNSLVTTNITQTPYDGFVSGNDVSNLSSHLENQYYVANADSPSFLKRLEGDFSADANGIESLVDVGKLASLGLSVEDKSVVDHIYFSSSNPAACGVSQIGMPSWFKLDSGHTSVYEVSCA